MISLEGRVELALDTLASLAVTVQSAPGTYALVLGSGISRSAGIPTGWEIVRILINRLAVAQDGVEPEDPFEWYETNVGDAPDYSQLIESLGSTPADRRTLLSEYFVPTDEDIEHGLKQPSRTHRSISRLVAKGYIKVIVTTNFDRLLEVALAEIGVQPIVISSADTAHGAMPLQHSECTIIKVNGDYLEPNIKNTVAELASYEDEMNSLLDRVFDEYGVIICGWSGDWDEALRGALNRNVSRRYGTFFAHKDALGDIASVLIGNRGGISIDIDDADSFFENLESKILGLEMYRASATTIATAKAQVKYLMADDKYRIRLHDLLFDEVKKVLSLDFSSQNTVHPTTELLAERMSFYEEQTAILNNLLFQLAFFADTDNHLQLIREVLMAIAQGKTEAGGYTVWMDLQFYPLTLATYAAGVAMASKGRVGPLLDGLPDIDVNRHTSHFPLFAAITPAVVLNPAACEFALGRGSRLTAASDYMANVVAKWAENVIVPESRIQDSYETFELLVSLVACLTAGTYYYRRSSWRRRHTPFHADVLAEFEPQLLSGSLIRFSPSDIAAAFSAWDRGIPAHW